MPTKKPATKKAPAKKAVAKKTAKKVVKKAEPKKAAKKQLKKMKQANGDAAFWMTNGMILKNLNDLADALGKIETTVFDYHVTKERNDFADWVESVLKDPECAAGIRRSKKPASARTVVVRSIKLYEA